MQQFSAISSDVIGCRLQSAMIWIDSPSESSGLVVAFRKTFELQDGPVKAVLSLFADARYVLWVNGVYVDRGPSRFQPNAPQYDSIDVTTRLNSGRNVVVLLVMGNLSGGKVMLHPPGLTAVLDADGQELLRTHSSWKWSDGTRFRKVTASWADLGDSVVDARVEDGDWTQLGYDDSSWRTAAAIDSSAWGPLTRTLIPPLRETLVPLALAGNVSLPIELTTGEALAFDAGRIVQAYAEMEIVADADAIITLEPFGLAYHARAGLQRHFTLDTRGLSRGQVTVASGRATIRDFKLIERLYPFTRLGLFTSNDDYLNSLWQMCARSCEVLSEDAYVDCADRERVEWMDNTPPGFDITRTAMAGPGTYGNMVYSDPRLLAALIRRTALTLQPDGWVKAHTCSDRYDIHAKMEDRAAAWVEGQRVYVEATGDTSIVRETWPAIVTQLDYFLTRRTARGLVRARDWVVWGNPVGYMVGEGTTLNAFIQRALIDAAWLGAAIGEEADGSRFATAAEELAAAINEVLWNEEEGAYHAGYFTDEDMAENLAGKRKRSIPLHHNLAGTTLHANVIALDREIVPAHRRPRVIAKMLEQAMCHDAKDIMVNYYILKQYYALDRADLDERVLKVFREKWAGMVAEPWQCSWEELVAGRGSKAHIYGMYPGYFLSAYVLGVRRDRPVSAKRLILEPHLGDLIHAEGVVVTEFGPVSVSWSREGGCLMFTCELPAGVTTSLCLPHGPGTNTLAVNGHIAKATRANNRWTTNLQSGTYAGRWS